MDVGAYLSHIGYAGGVEPSLDALRSLHLRHLLSVPFENLSVHSGGRVHLDPPLVYDKIVNQRRGGICFELNSLFSWLLNKLGFQVTVLSGQVRNTSTGLYGPPFDHFIVMVSLDGQRWLCDVGFGSLGFTYPVSLETSAPQLQGHKEYRIRNDKEMNFLELQDESNSAGDGWLEIYKFTLEPRSLEEFDEMCQHHQSSPCSLFFCKSLCTLLKPGGRISYVGRKMTSTTFPVERGGQSETTTRELKEEEIPGVLEEKFGVVLNSPLIPKDETATPLSVMY